jgi:hypothetical protein
LGQQTEEIGVLANVLDEAIGSIQPTQPWRDQFRFPFLT